MARKRTIPVTVNLTPRQKAWIDLQVDMGYFKSAEAYILEALEGRRRVPTFSTPDELERAALEGLRSGPGKAMTARDWDQLERRVASRLARVRRPAATRRKSA
jgi:Arc/MetJ-type ribon-helix-helix transcriptional regulator